MFERYTEKARRVVFFARYEASQFGSATIETEHLLLGLLREDKSLANRFLRTTAAIESIRQQIDRQTEKLEKSSTSVDLPLSHECKRVLAYAAEEGERLNHKHIGTPHLLLGMLREERFVAATLLRERGLRLEQVREEVARSNPPESSGMPVPASMTDPVPALVELLLSWQAAGGVTVAAKVTVGAHTLDFAIYAGNAVVTDGDALGGGERPPPSTPAEVIGHLRRQIKEIVLRMENAIANHNFERARFYSDREREARGLLHEKLEEHGWGGELAQPTPILCIEIAAEQSFSQVQKRCDDCLAAGVEQVWVLDFSTKRAYTATAAEGLRECKAELLRIAEPRVLEMEWKKILA